MQTPPTAPADTGNQAGAQTCAPTSLPFAALPALHASLAGGIYAGCVTQPDATTVAVVLLPDQGTDLTWRKALTWAAERGAQLPTRPVAALLFANCKALLRGWAHWTCEQFDASYAWFCYFGDGDQYAYRKSYQACAVSVRLIPVTA